MQSQHLHCDEAVPQTPPLFSQEKTVEETTGETTTPETIENLRQAATKRHGFFHFANKISQITVAASLVWAVIMVMMAQSDVWDGSFVLKGMAIYTVLMGLVLAFSWRGKPEMERAVELLVDSEDIAAVGPLVQAMEISEPSYDFALLGKSDRKAYALATVALKRLLPRLRSSDRALLDTKQRKTLYRALKLSASRRYAYRYDPDFALVILKALEQIGDEKARPVVEELANSAKDTAIRLAAQECLPFLDDLIREQQSPLTLLRAAPADSGMGHGLLRPASATVTVTDPAQLLRPASQAAPQED